MKEKKIETYQKLIEGNISLLKNRCETLNSEDEEYVSVGACDLIDSSVKVHLKDIKKDGDIILLVVDITYKNYSYIDEDSFIYELQKELEVWIGKNQILVREYTNTFPIQDRQW